MYKGIQGFTKQLLYKDIDDDFEYKYFVSKLQILTSVESLLRYRNLRIFKRILNHC